MGLAPILSVLLHLLVHDWYYVELLHGLTPILLVLLRLLVQDWYYVEFTAWACSHSPSTTPSTSSRLVLHGVYCMGSLPYC
jgi:hypothetical protein